MASGCWPPRPTTDRCTRPSGTASSTTEAAIVVAGDTVPCDGLDRLCAGADVYVQTVIRRSLVESVPMARFQDILDYHSSVEDAARTASRARASGPSCSPICVPPPAPGTEDEWIAEAAAHFDGEIILAPDLTT